MVRKNRKKYDGNRNPYKNRQKGKRFEYETVYHCRSLGWWAKRNPDRDQNKSVPIDVWAWDPVGKRFIGIQSKLRRNLLFNNSAKSKDEVKRILEYCARYTIVPMLSYKDRGVKLEIIN